MSAKSTKKNVEPKKASPETKKTTPAKKAAETKVTAAKPSPTGGKRKLVVSYKNLSSELLELVKEKFPKGYADDVIKVDKGNGDFFYAITLDTEDASYLIKVDVKIDTEIEEVERQLFGGGGDHDDDGGGSGDEFPDAEDEAAGFESEAESDE